MAIQTMTTEGVLRWTCMGGEIDEYCLVPCSAHVSEAMYRLALGTQGPRGAMIDLPACPVCGARCSLKADYTMKELFKATLTHVDGQGGVIGYSLKMPHMLNLLVHHWLYAQGKAEYAPVLGLPAREEVSDPRLATLPGNVVLALWFGYKIVQWRDPRLTSFDMVVQELAALPAGSERNLLNGTSHD